MSMIRKSSIAACVLTCLGLSSTANAADFNFNGFASVVGGIYSEDETTYAGYDDEFDFSQDTVAGIQISSQINDKFKATVQLIARGADDYDVEAELAFLTYSVNDKFDIRGGKLRLPFYYYSDFLEVGYAYPWIRTPNETYGRILVDSFEGIDFLYRSNHGNWSGTWQFFYGRDDRIIESEILNQDINTENKNFAGINIAFSNDWLTLRGGYVRSDITQDVPNTFQPLLDAMTANGFGDVANDWAQDIEKSLEYMAFAVVIDYNNWLLNAEYTTIDWNRPTLILNDESYFAMVGRRFDDVTVHFTYSFKEDDPQFEENRIPEAHPLHAALDGVLSISAFNSELTSYTAGVRYDIDLGVALKLEVSRFESDFSSPVPGQTNPLDEGTLVNFGVDVVF